MDKNYLERLAQKINQPTMMVDRQVTSRPISAIDYAKRKHIKDQRLDNMVEAMLQSLANEANGEKSLS
jgi:hypothetical protein